jgi:hypothetical protein
MSNNRDAINNCDVIQSQILEFGWTHRQREAAQQVLGHIETCDACRHAFDDYATLRAALTPDAADAREPAPIGGWEAFEQRMVATLRRKPRFHAWRAVAAGLLLLITAANGWMLLKHRPDHTPSVALNRHSETVVASDMTPASVAQAFRTVSEVFDGRANWVMLSDRESDLGLADQPEKPAEVLVLRFVVMRGNTPVSQMHVGVIPGATVRVSVPAAGGEQLQYVIATDAKNHQNISVSLAVESGSKNHADTGLGSIATTLNMPFGKQTPAGKITTRDGTFDLSLTLERARGT